MRIPSHPDAFEVLCLQAGDEGRAAVLFGDSFERARKTMRPLMVGREFPDVYLEFPLAGDPFLDVTVLYEALEPGTRIQSEALAGTGPLIDWCSQKRAEYERICFGFELDTKDPETPAAAVHFQPREETHLVRPFFELVGEPERADLYLGLAERMPKGWPLAFFGLFRGRPASPLRVCGYMADAEKAACAGDPTHLRAAFDKVGFPAYDEKMLEQVSTLMAVAPGSIDFQFDIYPDGAIGKVFAIDVQFEIEQPETVQASFADGPASRVMRLFEQWGIADDRWKLVADAAFARSLNVVLDEDDEGDGKVGRYAFTLMPQWVKARWTDGVLQPAKVYHLANAGLLDDSSDAPDVSTEQR